MRSTEVSFALSGSGDHMVSAVVGKPRNSISYFDFQNGTVRDLLTENAEEYLKDPDISDDGKRIAVVREPHWPISNQSEILIVNADGEVQDRIGSCNGWYRSPAFSPDGRKLLYMKYPNVNLVEGRSSGRAPMWQPMEYNFATGQEREVIDLAWLSVGWIDYGPPGRAQYYGRLMAPTGYDTDLPEPLKGKKIWNAPRNMSVLDNYTVRKGLDVFNAAFVAMSPEDPDPEKWIEPLYQNSGRSFAIRGGGAGVIHVISNGFIASDIDDRPRAKIIWVPWDGGEERVLSVSENWIYGSSVSRDGCVVLDARRARRSTRTTKRRNIPDSVTLMNICTGVDQELEINHDRIENPQTIMGKFENGC